MVLSMVVSLWLVQAAGCTKDTDCKGERICEAGVCVSPPAAQPSPPVAIEPPPPPPPPEPSPPPPPRAPLSPNEYPKVVRRDGQVCVQSLTDSGEVTESCRAENEPPTVRRAAPRGRTRAQASPAATTEAEAEVPRGRFVADVLVHGGLLAGVAGGAGLALPQVGGSIGLGGRFRSGVGVMGLANVSVGFGPGGSLLFLTLGPTLRVGDRSHFLLCLGPSLLVGSFSNGSGLLGTTGSLVAAGVFEVGNGFALTLQAAGHVDPSGVAFTLGAGFGFGAF